MGKQTNSHQWDILKLGLSIIPPYSHTGKDIFSCVCALIQKPSFPPAPSVSYDLMAGRVACARRVFPHEGSSGVVAQAGSVLGQTVRVPVFSQERTAVVLGCLHASSTINPNQVQMNR